MPVFRINERVIYILENVSNYFNGKSGNGQLDDRIIAWQSSLKLIRKNPVLGIGLGNYPSEYDPYFNTAYERGFMKTVPNAHLFFLSMVVDLGIAGFFLALVLYILPIREAMNALKNAKSIQDKAMTYGVLAGILSIFARSFFETGGIVGSGRPYPDILFWLLFCILLKINRPVKEPADKMCFLPIRGKS